MSISDHHLRSIGKLAVNFQFLETVIVLYVCELIGPDQAVGQIVATQLSFARLCAVTKALFEHRFTDSTVRKSFSELLRQASELEERRNQYFHSAWGSDDVSGTTVRVKLKLNRKTGLMGTMPEVTDAELDDVNEQLRACGSGLVAFGNQIGLFRYVPQ